MTDTTLEERLERVEATLAIQRLVVRYAMAVDARDLDTWVTMFPKDIDCGRRGKGRDVLRAFIDPLLRDFYRTFHQIVGHDIEVIDADHAKGRVYCKAEHERGDTWIVQAICYFDDYVREDGEWVFARRVEDFLYTADHLERPQDVDFKRWPGPAPKHNPPMLVGRWATWADFWARSTPEDVRAVTRHPNPGPVPDPKA